MVHACSILKLIIPSVPAAGSSRAYLGLPPSAIAKMLPSNNNWNNNNLVSYTDQSIFHRPFFNESNQTSKEDEPSLSFFHFPYELELEDHNFFLQQQYYDLLLQHQPLTPDPDDSTLPELLVNMVDSSNSEANGLTKDCSVRNQGVISNRQMPISKRSSSKKDRHSKINTAKGPRDRRMRLSLDVARKFFDLQDMLGYDKASKTVEWLMIQAKPEIKKLIERCLPEVNCCGDVGAKGTSECEVEAIIDNSAAIRRKISVKEKKIKHSRKIIRPLAKDLREKARARARERTCKKMWSREFDHVSKLQADEPEKNELISLGSKSSFGARDTKTQDKNHSLEVLADQVEEPSSQEQPVNLGNQEEIVDDALVIMGKWSPSSVSTYLQNIGIPQEVTEFSSTK